MRPRHLLQGFVLGRGDDSGSTVETSVRQLAGPAADVIRFHARVTEGFRELAAREADRCVLIDARRPVEDVTRDILAAVSDRLSLV